MESDRFPEVRPVEGLQVPSDDHPEVYHGRPAVEKDKDPGLGGGGYALGSSQFGPPSHRQSRLSPSIIALITGIAVFCLCTAIAAGIGIPVARSTCDSRIQMLPMTTSSSSSAASAPAETIAPSAPSSNTTNSTCPPAAVQSSGSPSSNIVFPPTGCNDTSTFNSTYISTQGQKFTKACNAGHPGNDIVAATVDSWELCMETCSTFNGYINTSNKGAVSCKGTVYVPAYIVVEWAIGNTSSPGNCFLKNSRLAFSNASHPQNQEVVLAIVQDS